ncbi:hypothetical protein BDF19DRAFT_449959 [Syncephalis fuscata]|nr:hypothetical protein BDF19DRAFT_449959 [Syncephalis fuscata]
MCYIKYSTKHYAIYCAQGVNRYQCNKAIILIRFVSCQWAVFYHAFLYNLFNIVNCT